MHHKTARRTLSLVLMMALCLSLLALGVSAADGPAVSSNINEHYYINAQRWTDPIKSTLTPEGDGFVRVECIGSALVVENYDKDLNYLSGKTLELELPIYGGVYMCDDYNFVVVGQNNTEEDDTKEVFRIIRYSKDWVRQASCGLYGANTTYPFDAGCVRFDRCGDYLYIRTSHEMYTTSDGLNHQSNVMINVRISDMTVTDSLTQMLNRNYGYISHSFNQFVRVDGTDLLAVDHGDALPRSVVLIKYNKPAGQDSFYGKVSYVNALPILDSTYHYNDTGVSVGSFEYSSSHYLIAGNAYDGTESIDLMYAHRNIFVTATPKDNFTDEATVVHWLTSYTAADQVDVSPPHMVKISADRFCLIWTEDDVLKYCFVNGKGELDGQILTGEGALSDCVPVVDGNRIIWYVTDNSAPVFYQIDLGSTTPDVTYTTASMSLAGDIGLNYYARLSEKVTGDPGAYMQFTVAGKTQTVPVSESRTSDGTYRFSCKLAAKQMTDEVTGQLYLSDGTAVGESKVYSIKAYCTAAIDYFGDSDPEMTAMMKAMLNYGAQSQLLFGYNTDDLANADLDDTALPVITEEDVAAYAHGATGSESGISISTVSLLLESTTTIRFYFQLDGTRPISDYTFCVDGVEMTPVQSGENQYYVEKVNVAAKNLDDMSTVTVGGLTARYGGLSYVRQVAVQHPDVYSTELVNTARALYAYNQTANAYFE